jgi:hypothetical protein
VTVTPRDDAGAALGPGHAVAIALSAGAPIGPVVDVGHGRYERTFVAHASRGQVGVVTASVDGVTLLAQPAVSFVADRGEVGRPFLARGGCAGAPAAPRTPGGVLFVALLCVAAHAQRRLGGRGRPGRRP